jgi:hypothetical protein
MDASRAEEYGPCASASRLGSVIVFPVGTARRQYLVTGTGDGSAGGGAVAVVGRPARGIGGGGRWLASPTNKRTNRASAKRCSVDEGEPMRRNHSEAEVMGIDIFGPPDVGGMRSVLVSPNFLRPGLAPGPFFGVTASLNRRAAAVKGRTGGPARRPRGDTPARGLRFRRCCVVSSRLADALKNPSFRARGAAPASRQGSGAASCQDGLSSMNPYQHSKLAAEIYCVIYNLIERGTLRLTRQDDVENLASSIAIRLNEKSEIEPEASSTACLRVH